MMPRLYELRHSRVYTAPINYQNCSISISILILVICAETSMKCEIDVDECYFGVHSRKVIEISWLTVLRSLTQFDTLISVAKGPRVYSGFES